MKEKKKNIQYQKEKENPFIFVFKKLDNNKVIILAPLQALEQQPSFTPKTLGLTMDPQQINQGQPHVSFFAILSYPKSYSMLTP